MITTTNEILKSFFKAIIGALLLAFAPRWLLATISLEINVFLPLQSFESWLWMLGAILTFMITYFQYLMPFATTALVDFSASLSVKLGLITENQVSEIHAKQ